MVSRIEMSLKPLRQPHLLSQEKETGDLGSKSLLDRVGEDSLSTPFLKFLYSYVKNRPFGRFFHFHNRNKEELIIQFLLRSGF